MNQKPEKRWDRQRGAISTECIMNRKPEKRWDRQRGAISTEYIIILILVALSLIVVVGKFGKSLMNKMGDSETTVNTQINIQQ